MNTLHTPTTPDPQAGPDRATLEERMSFQSRFVLVFGEIDDKMAMATCRRLLALAEQSDAPITLLVSSPAATSNRATPSTTSCASCAPRSGPSAAAGSPAPDATCSSHRPKSAACACRTRVS